MLKVLTLSAHSSVVRLGASTPRVVLALSMSSNGAEQLLGRQPKTVAVVGAGAAGLVAARELRREGHQVTVFEQADQVGGVWVYTDEVEDDPTGQSSQTRVHSSMYQALRTNLPRHVMAFSDLPFDAETTAGEDERLFPGHQEVLRYLQLFDRTFGISEMVRFNTRLEEAIPLPSARAQVANGIADGVSHGTHNEETDEMGSWPRWRLTSQSSSGGERCVEEYDALVVCNGHYSEPRVPSIPGADTFPGRQLHTHNFRDKEPFEGQVVVVMGASASGNDIVREIAEVADQVYFSARSGSFGNKVWDWEVSEVPFGRRGNIWRRGVIESLQHDGGVEFSEGDAVPHADTVVYATGYSFSFPFLERAGVVKVADNRVGPLYQHVFSPTHPTLSFLGLVWQVIPFPLMELQAKWVARVLAGRSHLPSREEMEASVDAFYAAREAEGVPVRYTHRLGEDQWGYNDWLCEQCGPDVAKLPGWRSHMHKIGQGNIKANPESYRDSWPEPMVVAEGELAAQEWRDHQIAAAC